MLSLPAIPNPQFASGRGVGPNMKKIFQLATLFVLARGGHHHLAQLRLTPAFLGHVSSPCAQFTKPAVLHRYVGALCCVQLPMLCLQIAWFGRSPIERPNAGQPLRFISIRRTFFASVDFGTVMVSTPFLNAAETLSSSTSSSGMRRSKRP